MGVHERVRRPDRGAPLEEGTIRKVIVLTVPGCDFCSRPAEYDGTTKASPRAYMCEDHFKMLGVGLDLGKGQQLEVAGDDTNE